MPLLRSRAAAESWDDSSDEDPRGGLEEFGVPLNEVNRGLELMERQDGVRRVIDFA